MQCECETPTQICRNFHNCARQQRKSNQGRIKNWTIIKRDNDTRFIIGGDFLDHDYARGYHITSVVEKIDFTTGIVETKNSIYRLVDNGEPSPRKNWPNPGEMYVFLGQNGYVHELAEAKKVFVVGQAYEVAECEVGDCSHSISFKDIPGHWNGVMFSCQRE